MALRRNRLTKPVFAWAKRVFPTLSETEREALAAGDVWWDAELFTGDPGWTKLRQTRRPTLSDEERAFLDGPVEALCRMVDDWTINWALGDLPPDVCELLKEKRCAAGALATPAGGRPGDPLLRSDEPSGGLGRRLDD